MSPQSFHRLTHFISSLHKSLAHPYVVKLFSYFDDSNFVYIILGETDRPFDLERFCSAMLLEDMGSNPQPERGREFLCKQNKFSPLVNYQSLLVY